jgi:hypothetical protein
VKFSTTIKEKSGIQWGKSQIRVLEGGRVHEKKSFQKMIGMIEIREKRGIQRDRSKTIVPTGTKMFFFYSYGVIHRS